MIIPHRELSTDALNGLIEAFVTREGTDYGEREVSLRSKVSQVKDALDRGHAVILYDNQDDSFTIVFKEDIPADVQ